MTEDVGPGFEDQASHFYGQYSAETKAGLLVLYSI